MVADATQPDYRIREVKLTIPNTMLSIFFKNIDTEMDKDAIPLGDRQEVADKFVRLILRGCGLPQQTATGLEKSL